MGLFDWFTKRTSRATVPLPQLCYDIAYFVLPPKVYNHLAPTLELCSKAPRPGAYFYTLACRARQTAFVVEDANRFVWHHGELAPGREYFALEYPVPPAVDMSDVPLEQVVGGSFVLAPHFSAIVRDTASGEVEYYILGQAPIGGGTTLRCVTREGMNCNLGPGPEPQLTAFLDAVRERVTRST